MAAKKTKRQNAVPVAVKPKRARKIGTLAEVGDISEIRRRAGKLGGKATLAKYGSDHFSSASKSRTTISGASGPAK